MINEKILVYILSSKNITVCNKRTLIRILSSGGIIIRNLKIKCVLTRKIDFKATLVYNLKFVKLINYKARDLIEFKGCEGSNNFDLFSDLFFTLFYRIFFIYSVIKRL